MVYNRKGEIPKTVKGVDMKKYYGVIFIIVIAIVSFILGYALHTTEPEIVKVSIPDTHYVETLAVVDGDTLRMYRDEHSNTDSNFEMRSGHVDPESGDFVTDTEVHYNSMYEWHESIYNDSSVKPFINE